MENEMKLEVGEKYTTFDISEMMACTCKREIVIKDKDDRGYIFALKGKRNRFYLSRDERKDKSLAVFKGHDLDLKADSDGSSFTGNALLNFVGTVEFVKDWIENKQLNPKIDKSLVVATTDPTNDEKTFMVYPEAEGIQNHACAVTIRDKQLVTA